MIGLGAALGVGSFLLMFTTVLALFRFEYGMPIAFSSVISCSVVLMGFLLVLTAHVTGLASIVEAAGGIATFLLIVTAAFAVIG